MMMLAKRLLAIILLLLTSASYASSSSQNGAYAVTKAQLAQWLSTQTNLAQGNELTSALTLVTKDEHVIAGEIKYQSSGSQCIAYAPHRYFDKHSYPIAMALFTECQVFLANTIHRNTLAADGQKSDLGKYHYSVTNAFIQSYANTVDQFVIYQIHGFDPKKRHTKKARNSDVIISHGAKPATAKLQQISQCLTDKLQLASYVYPLEVTELGGTKNILNKILPSNGEFFHIELSDILRAQLVQQPTLMSQFKICITL
jgi:hypothetical protein